MKQIIVLAVVMVVLWGCSSGHWLTRPDRVYEDFARDRYECEREISVGTLITRIGQPNNPIRDRIVAERAFTHCMEARGWQWVED